MNEISKEVVAKLKFWFGSEIRDLFSKKYVTERRDNFVYVYKEHVPDIGIRRRRSLVSAIEEFEHVLLEGLPENDECSCEDPELYYKIHHGNLFKEFRAFCLKCGGIAEVEA